MINLDIPVQTAHPHLDLSIRHRHRTKMEQLDNLESIAVSKRLRAIQDSHRIRRNEQYRSETEQIHRYTVLEKSRAFNQYKYQYYLGTQIDVYI